MNLIDLHGLNHRLPELQSKFAHQEPFRFVHIPHFFLPAAAEKIHAAIPAIETANWDNTTYINQVNKYTLNKFEKDSLLQQTFNELNSSDFRNWLEKLTGINDLIADETLFGAGLHQSVKGAQLNVHVDYNIHPVTKHHRRLNVLVYMNKNWLPEYKGDVEFWKITATEKKMVAKYAPLFNECVIFETNEHSYHGHPEPLNTPDGISRKSIAVYYYTEQRPESEKAHEHNTVYVNTRGVSGAIHKIQNSIKALLERIQKRFGN